MKTLSGKINLWENLNPLPYDRKEGLIANIKFSAKTIRKQLFFHPSRWKETQWLPRCTFLVHSAGWWTFLLGPLQLGMWTFHCYSSDDKRSSHCRKTEGNQNLDEQGVLDTKLLPGLTSVPLSLKTSKILKPITRDCDKTEGKLFSQ